MKKQNDDEGTGRKRSSIINESCNPVWFETLTAIDIQCSEDLVFAPDISIEVRDDLTDGELIGRAYYPPFMCKISGDVADGENTQGRWPKGNGEFVPPKWLALRRDNEAEIRTGYKRGSADGSKEKTPHVDDHLENDGEILVVLEIIQMAGNLSPEDQKNKVENADELGWPKLEDASYQLDVLFYGLRHLLDQNKVELSLSHFDL